MSENIGLSYFNPRANMAFRVQQVFSHVNDVFNKFNKYIAPAIHHDRCERSVQMRLYNMGKREFFLVFTTYFTFFGLSIFAGLMGPPITSTVQQKATDFMPNLMSSKLATGPFVVKSPAVSSYSQQLWVFAQFIVVNPQEEFFRKEFTMKISMQGITKGNSKSELSQSRIRDRTLSCTNGNCEPFSIMHLGYLEHSHYIFNLSFHGLENMHAWAPAKDVVFYFKTYNPYFTNFEIWTRFSLVLVTFVITCWFGHSLRFYPIRDWSLEQKWISVLLPLLLLYNDPLFPLIFLENSWFPSFIDIVFQSTFLFSILLFWISIYHGLRQNQRDCVKFYVPKILVVGWLWFCCVVVATAQKYSEFKDPLYFAYASTQHFYNFKIFFFIGVGIYFLFLLYYVVTAYSELKSMPYFDVRLKFVTVLMFCTAVVLLSVTSLKFGADPIEDNYAADLSVKYESSALFTAYYALLNLYVFVAAYVYSPSEKALLDNLLLKDNPALSMLNDSDEDVVYGSDDEARTPLNRGSNENEESD